MQVFFSCSGNDVIVVGHEHNVMNEKIIFFMSFLECPEENTSDLPLVETEDSVVGPTDQMVG